MKFYLYTMTFLWCQGEEQHSLRASHRKLTLDQVDLTDYRSHQYQNGFVHLNFASLSFHI